jgi:indolepyruvate ferredoxin oxidoreductase beta subunit
MRIRADVVVAGVGGQGALSTARLLAEAAHAAGLEVLQGELHGMSQRGGAVQAIVRISDAPLSAPLVGRGRAHLLVGLEPVEALRNLWLLSPEGRAIVSTHAQGDLPGYPDPGELEAALGRIPGLTLLDAPALARRAGVSAGASAVLLGAAAAALGLPRDAVEGAVTAAFEHLGPEALQAELRCLDAGWAA